MNWFSESSPTNTFVHPVTAVLSLGVLADLPDGTKISFDKNKIHFQLPGRLTALQRTVYNEGFTSISRLFMPLTLFQEVKAQFPAHRIKVIVERAKRGLEKLRKTYNGDDTTSLKGECVDQLVTLYLMILSQYQVPLIEKPQLREYRRFLQNNINMWNSNDLLIFVDMFEAPDPVSDQERQTRNTFLEATLHNKPIVISTSVTEPCVEFNAGPPEEETSPDLAEAEKEQPMAQNASEAVQSVPATAHPLPREEETTKDIRPPHRGLNTVEKDPRPLHRNPSLTLLDSLAAKNSLTPSKSVTDFGKWYNGGSS
jgi:hypothetical protein